VNRATIAAILVLIAASAIAEAEGKAPSVDVQALTVQPEVSIRFHDKRVYYTDSEIAIKVSVFNPTSSAFRFKLAENRMYSLAFDARTGANRHIEVAQAFKRARSDSGPAFYREISVEPGEEYSFVENLTGYISISESGSFAVQASFWPDLAPRELSDTRKPLLSNVLMLSVRPASLGAPTATERIKAETGELLKPESIPPDEVIRRTIQARQRSRWNEFFLYLDLEAILRNSADLARSFNRESDEGRRKMIERFKLDLQGFRVEAAMTLLPSEYEIVETRYTENDGSVRVMERFAEKGYISIKEYQYELRRREDVWYIVGYTVLNKGTE
jgi:hypothetical protein